MSSFELKTFLFDNNFHSINFQEKNSHWYLCILLASGIYEQAWYMFFIFFFSSFRYEKNGRFVLGVGFFSLDKIRLFN